MIRSQLLLDVHDELIVDNFAGGGGASCGIEMALGRHVDHAINHDRLALGMHRINHPQTIHHCEDVFDIDPAAVCEGRPVGLAHFSPDCKHFSKAKGGKPLDKRIRGLVLVMLRWAKYGARVMTMENVVEIRTWGPLKFMVKNGKRGWYPDPEHIGRTWEAFLCILGPGIDTDHPDLQEILDVLAGTVTKEECVRGFGYDFDMREIRACDHGSPTIRKRLFMVARRDGVAIVWAEPTFFDRAQRGNRRRGKPWRTIAECIEWGLPCPSIFLTGDEARAVRCKRPLAKATLRRIAMGMDRYVLKAKKPFLVSFTHQGGDRIEPIDEPARVITGAHRGEKGVVSPVVTEHANSNKSAPYWPADEPLRTQCANVKGGHFALMSANLMVNNTDHPGGKVDEPAKTVTSRDHHFIVAGNVVQTGYGERPGQPPRALDPEKPAGTVVAGGGTMGVVTGSLAAYYGNDEDGQSVTEPSRTVTTKDRLGFVESQAVNPLTDEQLAGARRVAAFLREHGVQFEGEFATVAGYVIIDIGLRMLTPRELFRAQGFSDTYVIDRAWVVDPKTGHVVDIRLTKEQQIRMCGNSVCPQPYAAIVRANVPELCVRYGDEKGVLV